MPPRGFVPLLIEKGNQLPFLPSFPDRNSTSACRIEISYPRRNSSLTCGKNAAHKPAIRKIRTTLSLKVSNPSLNVSEIFQRANYLALPFQGKHMLRQKYGPSQCKTIRGLPDAYVNITNSQLENDCIIDNYKNLWHIERAFRMSKTDLRIRPIYHRLRHRIEAHVCIAFTAYCIYKELETALYASKSTLSLKRAAEITHNIYQITYQLPDSKRTQSQLLKTDEQQSELLQIINQNF
jgi:hypothetical protein